MSKDVYLAKSKITAQLRVRERSHKIVTQTDVSRATFTKSASSLVRNQIIADSPVRAEEYP